MSTNRGAPKPEHGRQYVERVREDTRRYARDVLTENDRLRVLVASLQSERAHLEERTGVLEGIERENQTLQALLSTIETEKRRLQDRLQALQDESDRRGREHARLHEEITAIAERGRLFSQELLQIEQQNSNLANLYVATYQLHGSVERSVVLANIQEILANLVGTEQFVIFERERGGTRLEPVCVNGVDPELFQDVVLGQGSIGRAAASGDLFVADRGDDGPRGDDPALTACIPLKLGQEVIGAIAVFALLPQKAGFVDLDRELFDLLATQAATALYCASLHDRAAAAVGRAS